MKAQLGQFLNEFVSLSIMLLMAIALIAGQAGANSHSAATTATDILASPASIVDATAVIQAELSLAGSEVLSLHFEMVIDDVIESLSLENTAEILSEVVRVHLNSEK